MITKTHHLRVAMVLAGAALATCLMMLLFAPTNPAEAAFPGENGKIVFEDVAVLANPQNLEIYAIDPSDTSGVRRNLTNSAANEYAPAVSPDGSKIAFVRDLGFDQGFAIYTMNSNGSNKTPIVTGVRVDFNRSQPESIRPTFTSDGSKIAFADARDGDADIYLINSDGAGTPTNLTNNTSFDAQPAFSPVDENKMIFISNRSGNITGQTDLYVMDVSDPNSPATNLTNSQNSERTPSFSPGGDKIAFARFTNTLDIYVMNADGSGTPTNLTPTDNSQFGTDDQEPAFSPGGDKIAFAKIVRGGDRKIYTMNAADGSGQTPLTSVQTTSLSLDWGIKVPEPDDSTPPETSITGGPQGPTNDTTPTFSFSGTDDVSATENLLYSYKVDGDAWSNPDPSTTATLGGQTGFSDGSTNTFYVKAIDEAGNEDQSPAEQSFTVDTSPPTVTSVEPENKINVSTATNVEIAFSETIKASTLTYSPDGSIKLEKVGPRGTFTFVPAQLILDDPNEPTKATIDPDLNLARGAAYKVTVTIDVQDEAGNPLAEEKVAYFKVGGKS